MCHVSAPYLGVTKDNHDRRGSALEILALALQCVCFTTLFLLVLEPRRRALWSFRNLKAAEPWDSPCSYCIPSPPAASV